MRSVPGTLIDLIRRGRRRWQHGGPVGAGSRLHGHRHASRSRVARADPASVEKCVLRRPQLQGHIEEGARARGEAVKIPEVPVFFTKAPTSVNGPFDDIRGTARSRSRWTGRRSSASSSARPAATSRGRRARPRLRLHRHQRRDRARPAEESPPVLQGQEPRRLLPDGTGRGHRRRVRRPTGQDGRPAA